MSEPLPLGPGHPVPSQSWEGRRSALRGEFLPQPTKKKRRRWFNIKRKDYKDRMITPDRGAVIDAEKRLEQLDTDVQKGDTFTPPDAVRSAARRALKLIEAGHAGSGFTAVGRGRASDLAAGRSVSLDTIKRMHSYFARHEVDKQGKDWSNTESPSPGKVAWLAWGGDPGKAWAGSIVSRLEKTYNPDQPRDENGRWATSSSQSTESDEETYLGQHQPSDDGPPAWDLTAVGEEDQWYMPADVYDHPDWYVGDPGSKASKETIAVLRSIRGNPDAEVTIYRSAPSSVSAIEPGNWVTLSHTYAKEHGQHATDSAQDWPVLEMKVPVKEVLFAGDDLNEFGWFPQGRVNKKFDPQQKRDEKGRWAKTTGTKERVHEGIVELHPVAFPESAAPDKRSVELFHRLNSSHVPKEIREIVEGEWSGSSDPMTGIMAVSDDEEARSALKKRAVDVVSKAMAKDPEFVEWHTDVMKNYQSDELQNVVDALKPLTDDYYSPSPKNDDSPEVLVLRMDLQRALDRGTQADKATSFLMSYDYDITNYETPEKAASIIARAYIDQWAASAGGSYPLSWAIQRGASELFGVEHEIPESAEVYEGAVDEEYKTHEVPIRSFLKATYEQTQKELKNAGIKSLRVTRGYNCPRDDLVVDNDEKLITRFGERQVVPVTVSANPLTSWSTSWSTANQFVGQVKTQYESDIDEEEYEGVTQRVTTIPMRITAEIPAERILSMPCSGTGCYPESELVVIGGPTMKGAGELAAEDHWDEVFAAVMSGKTHTNENGRVFKSASRMFIDEGDQADWPKRTPDKMSDLARTPVAKVDPNAAMNAVRALNTNVLDDLVLEEIGRQAPKLSQALRRTMTTITDSPALKELFGKWVQGDFSDWQTELEKVASVLNVNPQKLAEALEIPMRNGFNMPANAMSKTLSVPFNFEYPDMWASKWSYVHAGEMITTQSKGMVKTIRNMVSEAMNGDMTTEDLKWSLRHNIKLPPRYSQAVKNYRESLRKSGMKNSKINQLSEAYARRLLLDHADTIARTEVMTALSKGQRKYWDDMAGSGILPTNIIMRMWSTSKDERTCATCIPMQGKKVAYNARFELPTGVWVDETPAHPRCRCSIVMHIPEPEDLLRARQQG
jgi:hypothetical protein